MSDQLLINRIGKGNPLILLHGWGWHSGIWQPLIPQLADYFELFLIDLPGFGKNASFDTSYDIEAIANQLFQVVPEQATWLGWSLGGMIAWWVALHHPTKVTRLSLLLRPIGLVSHLKY
jgi:pimeloyl-[acyl-carrier protein] methyl ester esterase